MKLNDYFGFFDVLLNKLGTKQLEIISKDRFLDQSFADRMKQKSFMGEFDSFEGT